MKPKTILVLIAAIVLGAIAIVWRKPSPAVPQPGVSEAPVVSEPAVQVPAEPVRVVRPARATASSSRTVSEIDSARLIREIQEGVASTNLETIAFALTNLLPTLVTVDPVAAARLAEALPETNQRAEVLRRVAQLWAMLDLPAVLKWGAALSDPTERDMALTDACFEMARSNPAEAIKACDPFVPDGKPSGALEGLAQIWADKEFTSALAWTLSRAKSEQRDGLISRLAFVQARSSPADAATLAVEQMTPGDAQNEAVISVLHQWALRDPASAGAWVERFPEGALRERALLELAGIATYRSQVP